MAGKLPLPVVVKPPCQGSTIGVQRVTAPEAWAAALADALRFDSEVLVETYISGRELTVGVVGDEALPVIEIVAPNGWYDYDAKYSKDVGTQYLVPAPLDKATAARCRALGLATFRALGCRGLGRVDIRMTDTGEMFVLELNTIPGFTETSLLPKAARLAGMDFPVLCDRIMRMATLD
jgi:D-alanine-D-alanine ligase